jgi:nicotinamide riboside transporter PnuC
MNLKKILLSGIAGGTVYFFLGYLFYGVLFASAMESPIAGVNRHMDQIIWWSMILGSLSYGMLVAFAIGLAKTVKASTGIAIGSLLGLLVSASFDFVMYAKTFLTSINNIIYDVAISTVIAAIAGAIVALVSGLVSKEK